MAATVQKWGNSLGLRIPKTVAEQLHLSRGTEVELDTTGGVLTIRPKRRRKHTLAALLAKVKEPSPHRQMDKGVPRGGELL